MKIWIDLTNSPHINFFTPFIERWQKENHEILLTCKNLSNTIELIKLKGWKYSKVDEHAGSHIPKKIAFYFRRVYTLQKFISKEKPDVGIGQASFESPLAARISNVPIMYLNDNEHALANYLAFPFASLVMLPEFLKEHAVKKKWENFFNISYYPGIKEGIYLSQLFKNYINPEKPNKVQRIFFRPEPWEAHYYKGKKGYLKSLLMDLANHYEVYVLPRNDDQIKYFKGLEHNSIRLMVKPLPIEKIVSECDLFIGAGGTMNREIAILGIPTISTYQDKLLKVDEYLIDKGIMFHLKNLNKELVQDIIEKNIPRKTSILSKGNEAFEYINSKVMDLSKQV